MGLLEDAQRRTYRFPPEFAGFTAIVRSSVSADSAKLEVRGKRDLDLFDGDDWTREQVASIVGHRWASDFHVEGDGRFPHRVQDDGDPTGVLVHLEGEPMSSSYRIGDGTIVEVHRTVGDMRFTIVITGGVETGQGRLPQHFSVYYWSLGDETLSKVDQVTDHYDEVGGVWLPRQRTVTTVTRTGLSTRILSFNDRQLREA